MTRSSCWTCSSTRVSSSLGEVAQRTPLWVLTSGSLVPGPAAHTAVMSGQAPTEGPLTVEELQLAARNHGMPLEALRYDLTPAGLHYLLVHFDIPEIDESSWRLDIAGSVEQPRSFTLEQLRARPSRTLPVTMECAGNGRAKCSDPVRERGTGCGRVSRVALPRVRSHVAGCRRPYHSHRRGSHARRSGAAPCGSGCAGIGAHELEA